MREFVGFDIPAPYGSGAVQILCIVTALVEWFVKISPPGRRVADAADKVRGTLKERKIKATEEFVRQALEVDSAIRTDSFSQPLDKICSDFVAAWDENTGSDLKVAHAHDEFDGSQYLLTVPVFGAILLLLLTVFLPGESVAWALAGVLLFVSEIWLIVRLWKHGKLILDEARKPQYVRRREI